jgi:hypothetical protein
MMTVQLQAVWLLEWMDRVYAMPVKDHPGRKEEIAL